MMKRRQFLKNAAAGSAVLTMPSFLAGCGVQPATNLAQPAPENPFLEWFALDEPGLVRVMRALTAGGADAGELYLQHGRSNSLVLENGIVTRSETAIQQGAGARVIRSGQAGFAATEDLTIPGLEAAARAAASIASSAGPGGVRTPVQQQPGSLYVTSTPWADVGGERRLSLLQVIEAEARRLDAAVQSVAVSWEDGDERILVATVDGRLVADSRPMTRVTVVVTATRAGETHSGFANIAARDDIDWYTHERLKGVAADAVSRTLSLFEARPVPGGETPVILAAGTSGILLHEAIGHALEADFNRDGTGAYAQAMGTRVAGEHVTLVDDAAMPNERGALNFDDEGNRGGRNVLIENGTLGSYLHDTISAGQYGVDVTGSARRQSYRFAPMPRMSCTFMADGPHTRDEIIAAVDRGIIAETFTIGRVALGSGDYAFTIKNGYLVEKGRIVAPIRDVGLVGNGPETLRRISMVADDSRLSPGGWTCGKNGQYVPVSHGMPTVLVTSLAVAAGKAQT
jgi:TldD protein